MDRLLVQHYKVVGTHAGVWEHTFLDAITAENKYVLAVSRQWNTSSNDEPQMTEGEARAWIDNEFKEALELQTS
jgi:hypothetical protein